MLNISEGLLKTSDAEMLTEHVHTMRAGTAENAHMMDLLKAGFIICATTIKMLEPLVRLDNNLVVCGTYMCIRLHLNLISDMFPALIVSTFSLTLPFIFLISGW